MNIQKFSKQRNGMYQIQFDSFSMTIHEALILKYQLLYKKQIDEELLDQIRIENQKYEAYEVALRCMKTKLRSEKELKEFLFKKEFGQEQILDVCNQLKNQGYLDDHQYTEAYIHDRICFGKEGPLQIVRVLKEKGIPSSIIEEKMVVYTLDIERDKLTKIVDKLVKGNRTKSSSMLKRKIQGYLQQRGYHSVLIQEAVDDIVVEDCDLAKKEYRKLKEKLSRKYEGKELAFQLKQKMYQRGFSNYEED